MPCPRLLTGLLISMAWLSPAMSIAAEPATDQSLLREAAAAVSPAELKATIQTLVGFGTRHTLSDTVSDTRGIGAARRWVQRRFGELSRQCGQCLEVVTPSQTFTGPRMPQPTEVMDIVAIQRGSSDANRVILITGHLDSRVSDIMNSTSDAPGANDDASGVAAVLEAARVLSKQRLRATVVYAALSGEEQGLYGGKVLAEYARAQGWQVQADLNNDIVGNSHGQDGVHDNSSVRVFSEGTKALETPAQAARRRYNGGEVDSPSRNIARFMASLAERYLTNLHVQMVYRTDRYGRGGDQVAFLDMGFPAVRVTEAHEDYTHQHQDLRVDNGVQYGDTIEFVDVDYLAQVARLNIVALAAMANAPAPPKGVGIEGAVTPDTTLKWEPQAGAAGYRVWWRSTTEPQWKYSRFVAADAQPPHRLTLKNVVIDDWFFGVSSVSADGYESPVVFPGDPGAF
ncbi:M20/M25/M40 family metallo-hydrolase [Ideonella sp.]|uniref:M20/M25/M40 family metallo-hydrolase n=1 Tax=Ideonella sp. TaxID=1929293 RepID=UPI0035B4CF8F